MRTVEVRHEVVPDLLHQLPVEFDVSGFGRRMDVNDWLPIFVHVFEPIVQSVHPIDRLTADGD